MLTRMMGRNICARSAIGDNKMQIPDYDDFDRLESKIERLQIIIESLVRQLPEEEKEYWVGGEKFNSKDEAQKKAKELLDDFNNRFAGATGCGPSYPISVFPRGINL